MLARRLIAGRAAQERLRLYAWDERAWEVRQAGSTCEVTEQGCGSGCGGGGGKQPGRGEHGQANTSRTQGRARRDKRVGSCAPSSDEG
jgi:hypothetical protein